MLFCMFFGSRLVCHRNALRYRVMTVIKVTLMQHALESCMKKVVVWPLLFNLCYMLVAARLLVSVRPFVAFVAS